MINRWGLLFVTAIMGVLLVSVVFGLAFEQIGPDSVNRRTVDQPDWCLGVVELARQESRVYSLWVDFNENFYFKANVEEINHLLKLYSAIRMEEHEVWLEAGTGSTKTMKGDPIGYNVHLHNPGGFYLHSARDEGPSEKYAIQPQMTICMGDNAELKKKLKIPENVVVIDTADAKEAKAKSGKKTYYGRVNFTDGAPAGPLIDINVTTQVVRWDEGVEGGIPINYVDRDGYFKTYLSEETIKRYQTGKSWLTVHGSGHWREGQAKKVKYPFEFLATEREKAQAATIERPEFFYGRVLFEDGSIPVLDPLPWPGAKIKVGTNELDEQGYFKLYLSKERYDQDIKQEHKMRIYVPSYQEKGASIGKGIYPVALLAHEKDKAGVVKITRPLNLSKAGSWLGKMLPDLEAIDAKLAAEQIEGKLVLLCFFDLDQVPSRNCVTKMVTRAAGLAKKNVIVIGVQTGEIDQPVFDEMIKAYKVPFRVVMVIDEVSEKRFNWGVKALPWMILTDKEHVVTAEGFGVDELEELIR